MPGALRSELEALYKRCCPLLLHITRSFAVAPEVGDEIVQEAFLRLARQSAISYSDGDACQRFLIVTTRHLLIDERRKKRPVPVADVAAAAEPVSATGTVGEGRLAQVAELWEQFKPLKDFAVFADYYQMGWSTEEIAARRKLPAGTVRAKIHRLRELFRRKMRERLDLDCNRSGKLLEE